MYVGTNGCTAVKNNSLEVVGTYNFHRETYLFEFSQPLLYSFSLVFRIRDNTLLVDIKITQNVSLYRIYLHMLHANIIITHVPHKC